MWRGGPLITVLLVLTAAVMGHERPPEVEPHLPEHFIVPAVAPAPAPSEPLLAPIEVVPAPARSALSFEPSIPVAPRRRRHRPARSTAPPGGLFQLEAAQAVRDRRCATGLEAVEQGMAQSPDHEALYRVVWDCFQRHQVRLLRADVEGLPAFLGLLRGLQGPPDPELILARLPLGTEIDDVMPWALPPTGGIEYRLGAWMDSWRDPQGFALALEDLVGEPVVADALAADVLIELQAAIALAAVADPRDEIEQLWARRIYWAAQALSDPSFSELIYRHRPELVPELQRLFDEATTAAPGRELPVAVQLAMQLGTH